MLISLAGRGFLPPQFIDLESVTAKEAMLFIALTQQFVALVDFEYLVTLKSHLSSKIGSFG
tara:strand:+ start:1098 stop:1280 length:183 start_codon:yes stop_codon:yes gene_type:complete